MTSRKSAEKQVETWGFQHVFTWHGIHRRLASSPVLLLTEGFAIQMDRRHCLETLDDSITETRRNAYYPPHSHSGLTTHLLLDGELTISYPEDAEPRKETFGPGARLDVDAGRTHQVWMGKEGCTYVIGE